MIVYRLIKSKYSRVFNGKGAETFGGRWNSKGIPLIYTCESRALCTAEIAVHSPLGIVPQNYSLLSINIPDTHKIIELEIDKLPKDWKSFPHSHSTQVLGDLFVTQNKNLILKVPSVVVQGDHNYLINPQHKDFKLLEIIKIEKFEFDSRLFT